MLYLDVIHNKKLPKGNNRDLTTLHKVKNIIKIPNSLTIGDAKVFKLITPIPCDAKHLDEFETKSPFFKMEKN